MHLVTHQVSQLGLQGWKFNRHHINHLCENDEKTSINYKKLVGDIVLADYK